MLHTFGLICCAIILLGLAGLGDASYQGVAIGTIKNVPFVVSIRLKDEGNRHLCGGSIVSNRFILTSAYCVSANVCNTGPGNLQIAAGSVFADGKGTALDPPQVLYDVVTVFPHPNYAFGLGAGSNGKKNDIAMLKTKTAIHFEPNHVTNVGLAGAEPAVGSTARALGWGTPITGSGIIQEGASQPRQITNLLNRLPVTIQPKNNCNPASGETITVPAKKLCSTSADDGAVCQGDFGGPLVAGNTQIGIISDYERLDLGSQFSNCNEGDLASIYTSVHGFSQWIQNTMSQQTPPSC